MGGKILKFADERHAERMRELEEQHAERMRKLEEQRVERMRKIDEQHAEEMRRESERIAKGLAAHGVDQFIIDEIFGADWKDESGEGSSEQT
ncbi:MAG: hypothetical protein SOH69_03360 [Olsenella sp.]